MRLVLTWKVIGSLGEFWPLTLLARRLGAITKATLILGAISAVANLTKEAVSLSVQFEQDKDHSTLSRTMGQKAAKLVTDLQ